MSISTPFPMPGDRDRRDEARRRRVKSANLAFDRHQPATAGRIPSTRANGEENFVQSYSMSFTKGLPRDAFGIVVPVAYEKFVEAINAESAKTPPGNDLFDMIVPLGPPGAEGANVKDWARGAHDTFYCTLQIGDDRVAPVVRTWESPRAGHAYETEGPDADAVCMPPAPTAGSTEMAVEMAEVYALALLRDVPFTLIGDRSGSGYHYEATDAASDIAEMAWFRDASVTGRAARRRTARGLTPKPTRETAAKRKKRLDDNARNLFRGSTPGCQDGPFLSQFMLIGTEGRGGRKASNAGTTNPGNNACFEPDDGYIVFGEQIIDQRCFTGEPGIDFMTEWHAWMDVQNGADMKAAFPYAGQRRFITTPRDLAAYVHNDALYQAYLNACLILQGTAYRGAAFEGTARTLNGKPLSGQRIGYDIGLPTGPDSLQRPPDHRTRGSFATFGDPHILALLTEVSTRALRAVRRQKFNFHRRCRPEAIGAMLSIAHNAPPGMGDGEWDARRPFNTMLGALPETLMKAVDARNSDLATTAEKQRRAVRCPVADPAWLSQGRNYLLPMAFAEGSPMHPAYGAGHATVAGACVTVLKAFFRMHDDDFNPLPLPAEAIYVPSEDGARLQAVNGVPELTVAGELNKLAANIAIGRNMAGVHFYTDYYDSLRMGERIAVGILQEQLLNFAEPVNLSLPGFDGESILIINTDGTNDPSPRVLIGGVEATQEWWLCET